MRKYNAVCSAAIILLLIIHAVAGIFQMTGVISGGNRVMKVLAYIMTGFVILHIIFGFRLTIETLFALHRAGKSYFRDNLEFWIRRISGFALVLLILYHVIIFTGKGAESFRLNMFGGLQLAGSILLVIALLVHICVNIRPLLISFGIAGKRVYVRDILFIISIIAAICAVAFIVYYLRWNITWRYGS